MTAAHLKCSKALRNLRFDWMANDRYVAPDKMQTD